MDVQIFQDKDATIDLTITIMISILDVSLKQSFLDSLVMVGIKDIFLGLLLLSKTMIILDTWVIN